MNDLIAPLFAGRKADPQKLAAYGFVAGRYTTALLPDFSLTITVVDSRVSYQVTDLQAQAPYTLFENPANQGAFVAKMRLAVLDALTAMRDACFDSPSIFHQAQTLRVLAHAKATYNVAPEFLWTRFPDNAVLRRADNRKWFAAILAVAPDRLKLAGKRKLEVLDLRMDPADAAELIDGVRFLPGYHMNKQHWYTVVLDDRVPDAELFARLKTSFALATK